MTPTTTPRSNNNDDGATSSNAAASYYQKGSEEVATATPLIMRKLEKRRILTSKSERLVIVLVGLPARGKSFISRKLRNFLLWNGSKCKIFNVGKYRREATAASNNNNNNGTGTGNADFFSATNEHANKLRQQAADLALRDMLRWLDHGDEEDTSSSTTTNNNVDNSNNNNNNKALDNPPPPSPQKLVRGLSLLQDIHNNAPEADRVAIFDATNSTNERRSWILQECSNHSSAVGVVFVESICDDEELLRENYQYKIRSSPDFCVSCNDDEEAALEDLRQRVRHYEEQYETITDDHQSYIKIFNLSTKLMVNHIYGRMAKLIVPAIMAWNVGTRPIFLCRAGETMSTSTSTSSTTMTTKEEQEEDGPLLPPPTLDCDSPDSSSSHQGAVNWIKHHMMNASTTNATPAASAHHQNHHRRTESSSSNNKLKKGTKLGAMGIKFRNALEDYIERECISFMRKQQEAHFSMDTGTSLSGLAAYHRGGPLACLDEDESSTIVSATTVNDDDNNNNNNKANMTSSSSSLESSSLPLVVLTSTLPRAVDTAMFQRHSYPLSTSPNLNPLDKGDYTGMELEEIRSIDPQWFHKLTAEPYFTRFPGGESYSDLITRLEPIIIDMEQQTAPVLLVSHISVLQTLITYFRQEHDTSPTNECMGLEVPLHTVIKFTPSRGGGWVESRHSLLSSSSSALSSSPTTSPSEQQQQQPKLSSSVASLAANTIVQSANSSSSSILQQQQLETAAVEANHANDDDDAAKRSPKVTMKKTADKVSTPIWGDHLVMKNGSTNTL